jgi:hypothetical protein
MSSLIVAIGIGAVTLVLLLGMINMLQEGSASRSQALMRWRIGLQFAVILIIISVLWFRS